MSTGVQKKQAVLNISKYIFIRLIATSGNKKQGWKGLLDSLLHRHWEERGPGAVSAVWG